MKKLFFAVVITVFTMTSVNAQQFGVKAGLNIASLSMSGSDSNSSLEKYATQRLGLNIGVFAEFEITDEFSFQPELVYSMQGKKYVNGDDEFNLNFDYLNLPLMGKYYVTDEINIQLGPQIGFLMNAEEETVSGGNSDSRDVKKDLNNIDFGLNFGAGYKMDNGFFFDARYNLGLSDLADDRDSNDNGRTKNGVINFSIGYIFQ